MNVGGTTSNPCRLAGHPRLWMVMAAIIFPGGLISGCAKPGPARFHIEGRVTYDGKPVPNGVIRFEADATQGNGGPVGYAAIKDGRYTTAEQGSKGSLKGPVIAVLSGGPPPEPSIEFPKMWFDEFTVKLLLEPTGRVTTLDFEVPIEKGTSHHTPGKIGR